VRIGIPGKITGMHSHAAIDPHEVGHGRAAKKCPRGFGILHDAYVPHDHVPGRVYIVTVEVRTVIPIFLDDPEASRGCLIPLAPA
jgi:hypothetical protein